MWDTFRLSMWGNFSLRKIAVLFIAVLTSALFVAIANSSTSFAAPATWDGDNLKYNDHAYTNVTSRDTIPDVDPNAQIYMYKPDGENIAYVIEVPEGQDPTKDITGVELHKFKYENGIYSGLDPPDRAYPQDIIISARAAGEDDNKDKTSCAVEGIGWIVCGISKFLAGAMDKAYEWISAFLVVKPLSNDTDSGLYQAWNIARGLANACFIVAFLLIIYAQITSYGISNYEIKKMIPKLIIAAILVNVSFYICAYAVDISNILGDSVQKALIEIRESLPAPEAQTSWGSWGTMTAFILSAGTIGAIGIGASGGVLALVPLLVPVLIGGVFSLLIALMVLAARQAIITVLIVLAPLAFVAYLLPNTEKWFNRWRELLMNMLLIFPLFSLLFGGSQLASYLIIQNTDQISVVILAMFIQVAPLMVTPFLLRISHGLLTQLGGLANNRQKGLVDRSRNWANERSEMARERHNAKGATKPWYTTSGMSYRRTRGKTHRANALKESQTRVAAAIANEQRSQETQAAIKAAELHQSVGDAKADRLFEENKATSIDMKRDSGMVHLEKLRTSGLQEADEARWQEALSERMDPNSGERYAAFSTDARAALLTHHIADQQKSAAESLQKKEFVNELRTSPQLQQMVGGIDPHGASKAYAKAKAASYAAKAEVIKDIENGSDIMPGKTVDMVAEFERGIRDGEVETVRAMINKMASSANPGAKALRDVMERKQGELQAAGMLDEIKFHLNGHPDINASLEDLAAFSRDGDSRPLEVIYNDPATWSNMTANKFIGQKQSTQEIALRTGGIRTSTLRDIINDPSAKINIKPPVLEEIYRQLGLDPDTV